MNFHKTVWRPISRHNCNELNSQSWESTVAGNELEASRKMTLPALQRTFKVDESLRVLTNDLLHRREKILMNAECEVNRTICNLNAISLNEIKSLTLRLMAYLDEVRSKIEKCQCYEEIIPEWETAWNTNVEQWRCDVEEVLTKLKENMVQTLYVCKESIISTEKFTLIQVPDFFRDHITKINQLIIVNEQMYTDTELHLKLMFDSFLQSWLISYSYQEIAIKSWEGKKQPKEGISEDTPPETRAPLMEKLYQMIEKLDVDDPEFSQITPLKRYLNHLRICQNHAKLYYKEALGHLKNHLNAHNELQNDDKMNIQLEELWIEIFALLKEQNDDFKNYNKQSAHAWNQFVKRLHCAEVRATDAISRMRFVQLTKILASEEQMNSLLDQLRESSSAGNMENLNHRITNELENAEINCVSCRNEEDAIIHQLINAFYAAYDIFSVQMSYLNHSSLNSEPEITCMEYDLEETKVSDPELVALKYCMISAQTWNYGFRETLSLLEAELLNFLKMLFGNIYRVYKGESEYWLMLQLERLMKRKQRIQQNIFDIRAYELKTHETIQKNIVQTIDFQVKRMKVNHKNIEKQLHDTDSLVIAYLEGTKTNKLEDTFEKKIKHLKDEEMLNRHEANRMQLIRKNKYDAERIFHWLGHVCSSYLQSLRLFSEGGNYSSDECELALKKINNISKKLPIGWEKTVQKLDQVLASSKETFKKRLSKIVYPEPTEEELLAAAKHEADDRLNICFNRLKEMIKNETYKATQDLGGLREIVNRSREIISLETLHEAVRAVQTHCGYFTLSQSWPVLELSTVLQKTKAKISPTSMSETSMKSPDNIEGDEHPKKSLTNSKNKFNKTSLKEVNKRQKKKSLLRRSSQATNQSMVSFASLLRTISNSGIIDEDNYLANVKTLISDTYAHIQPIITDTYYKYKRTKVHYTPHVMEAYARLMHYNLQCEAVWTILFRGSVPNTSINFLNVLLAVYCGTLSYLDMEKERFIFDLSSQAAQLKASHKIGLAKLNVDGVKGSIDNKLKPWHGYPLNKPLLQELLKNVADHCKAQLTSRKAVNETYRDSLKEMASENKRKAHCISEDAKFLIVELINNSELNSNLKFVDDYVRGKDFGMLENEESIQKAVKDYCWNSRKVKTLNREQFDEIDFIFMKHYKFRNYPKYMEEIMVVLNNIFRIVRPCTAPREQTSQWVEDEEDLRLLEIGGENIIQEQEISPIWYKFSEEIQKHLQEFEIAAITNVKEAKKEFDRVSGDLIRWKNQWISNIKEVNRLYLINPILEKPPNKLVSDPGLHLRSIMKDKKNEYL